MGIKGRAGEIIYNTITARKDPSLIQREGNQG